LKKGHGSEFTQIKVSYFYPMAKVDSTRNNGIMLQKNEVLFRNKEKISEKIAKECTGLEAV